MRTYLIAAILCLWCATMGIANQIAVAEDGRKVLLKDDGTWEYVKAEQKKRLAISSTGNYIRTGNIGEVSIPEKKPVIRQFSDFPCRKVEAWVGEEFIFLPTGKDYKLLKGQEDDTYNSLNIATWFMNLPYKEYVGRIAKVTSVSEKWSTNEYSKIRRSDWIVELMMVDTKERLCVKTQGSPPMGVHQIPGIGLVADIDKARELWLGKNLWCTGKGVSLSTFNAGTKKSGSLFVLPYNSLKVTDIVSGESNEKPVRFFLRTLHGKEGYIDVDLSGTNASNTSKRSPLKGILLTKKPRQSAWSESVWSTIMERKVFIGMTAEQARMSWGVPKEINKTITGTAIHEQWVYGTGSYLYFDDGVLTTIQQ